MVNIKPGTILARRLAQGFAVIARAAAADIERADGKATQLDIVAEAYEAAARGEHD